MSRTRSCVAAVLAATVVGVVACSATTPVPDPAATSTSTTTPAGSAGDSPPTPGLPPSPSASETATPSTGSIGLGDEIEIKALDERHSEAILEFASDGAAAIFSSGIEPDAAPDAAPDLWQADGTGDPELVWRNPERDHSLVRVGGAVGTLAFVDMPIDGERAWTLWLIPRPGEEAFRLDQHPGDEDVPSLVPSFSIAERQIVWTTFARGDSGPVSRLMYAGEPDWRPTVLSEVPVDEAEFWLPSFDGSEVAYTEVRYSPDRLTDERAVYLTSIHDPATRRRLDTSGLATMPLLVSGAVLWKEADPGFNMFNWGQMYRYDRETGEVRPLNTWPQEYVNYPSAGDRFVAWWGADSARFGVYDLVRGYPRLIQREASGRPQGVVRPHVHGDLLVWLHVDGYGLLDDRAELRFADLPHGAADRGR